MTRIRLTRKLCPLLNGFDLSGVSVGDTIELPSSVAAMLVREGWAEPEQETHRTNPEPYNPRIG
jgi:hypothetical protein